MGAGPLAGRCLHLTSCMVKSRQGPTSSRYTLSRKGLLLSRVGDSLQAWNSAKRVVSTCREGAVRVLGASTAEEADPDGEGCVGKRRLSRE